MDSLQPRSLTCQDPEQVWANYDSQRLYQRMGCTACEYSQPHVRNRPCLKNLRPGFNYCRGFEEK